MDIFGIIYKALNKLNNLVTGLRKDVDNKQAKLTYADGNEVTNYKDLKLSMLKGLPFRDTVLIVNDTKEDGHYVTVTTETSSREEIIVHDQDYTIYIKDPVKYFYSDYAGGTLQDYVSACLSMKTPDSSASQFSNCEKLTYCGYIDTMDSSAVSLGFYFSNCKKLNYIPDYFVQVPITSMDHTFYGCESLTRLPKLDTSLSENFSGCCAGCGMYEMPNWDFSKGENFYYFCKGANNLISVDLNLPEATDIQYGFSDCGKLTTCTINAPKATTILEMLRGCESLNYCNIRAENTQTAAYLLMQTSSLLEAELSFEKVSSCYSILSKSGVKTVSINAGNKVTMTHAFSYCHNLETVVLSGSFSTLEYAFYECSSLKELPAIQVSDDEYKPTHLDSAFNHTALTKFPMLNGYVDFGNAKVQNDFVQEIPRYNTSMSSLDSHLIFETPQLTTVGGFIKMSSRIVNFYMCPLLTRNSILNIFNDLNSIPSGSLERRIIFHEEAYNRLSEEDIAIAVNKRWTVEKSVN